MDPTTQSISLSLSNGVVVMKYVATFSVYIKKLSCWGRCPVQALCAGRYSGIMSGVHICFSACTCARVIVCVCCCHQVVTNST